MKKLTVPRNAADNLKPCRGKILFFALENLGP